MFENAGSMVKLIHGCGGLCADEFALIGNVNDELPCGPASMATYVYAKADNTNTHLVDSDCNVELESFNGRR